MLWYLLYPVRGTTDPPRLPSENPVRRAFYRHGTITARHWLLSMLVSVTIGVILTYPVVFMSDFPSNGISGLPHHVWTGSTSLESQHDKQPDVEMRQVWIHGTYMEALNKPTLKEALLLQNALLGDASAISRNFRDYPEGAGWGYHSPLMYWNNSLPLIEADTNILQTVNDHAQEMSFLNFTIRPLSVFAGKSYRNSKLVSADALVITLINRHNDSLGLQWQENIVKLASQPSKSWTHSGDDEIGQSRVFEYRFQPLSFRQNSALAAAYGIMLLYVAVSLRRLKAFRSRFGLVVTAITQMTTSILASFTICGLLKINLAQIPQEAYPFVVLTIGLENIFRLINAVLAYPPEMVTTQRIANGLGDIGHSSLASAAQNLVILWILSLVVSPGVSAFCAFAAVALLFDYFFLITFFVAVLNVDIQRLELQDSITRSRSPDPKAKKMTKATGSDSPDRPSWIDAIIRGRVPFSTRIAGSAVTITFVLALNWHFSENSIADLRSQSWAAITSKHNLPSTEFDGTSPPPMNQTRHPSNWLRSQDYGNAAHFMNIVKPGAYSFTARVFDPLIIVLAGADRSGVPLDKDTWLSAIRNLAIHNFYPFALAVVFVVAFVTVLMNFLLWNAGAEKEELESAGPEPQLVSSTSIKTSHALDIFKMFGDGAGNLLSVGLDRTLSATLLNAATSTHRLIDMRCRNVCKPGPEDSLSINWPISECYMFGKEIGIICGDGQLMVHDLDQGQFVNPWKTLNFDQAYPPLLVHAISSVSPQSLMVVLPEGVLIELEVKGPHRIEQRITDENDELVSVCAIPSASEKPDIVGLTSSGKLVRATWNTPSKSWHCSSNEIGGLEPRTSGRMALGAVLQAVPKLGMVMLCYANEIMIIHNSSLKTIGKIAMSNARSGSVRVLHSYTTRCQVCGSVAVTQLSIVFTDANSGECVMLSHVAASDDEVEEPGHICLTSPAESCTHLTSLQHHEHRLRSPGAWEGTTANAIAGVRRRPVEAARVCSSIAKNGPGSSLRQRRAARSRDDSDAESEEWEAYVYLPNGELHTTPLAVPSDNDGQLYVAEPGPACRAGPASVAVALGNTIHIVKMCRELAKESGVSGLKRSGSAAVQSRKRNNGRKSL